MKTDFEISIESHSKFGLFYRVVRERRKDGLTKWHCSCPHNVYRGVSCKHIKEAQLARKMQNGVNKKHRKVDLLIEVQEKCVKQM